MRLHILGAAGSGTTTLGAAVAARLGLTHLDTDTFYWLPTDPPFTASRPVPERLAALTAALPAQGGWVLSGAATRWGATLEPLFDLIVFLHLDPAARMDRLRRREAARYGPRIAPGGDMAATSAAFMAWAAAYDTAGPEQRSRAGQDEWLARQTAPVLRLDSARPVAELVDAVVSARSRMR